MIALAHPAQMEVYENLLRSGIEKERIYCLTEELLEELKTETLFEMSMESVRRGHQIAKRILSDEDTTHWFIKNQHNGDAAGSFRFIKVFREYYSGKDKYYFTKEDSLLYDYTQYVKTTVCKKVIVVTKKSIAGLVKLVPWVDDVVILNKRDLNDLELYAKSPICMHKTLHYDDQQDWIRTALYKIGTYNWQLMIPNENVPIELEITKEVLDSGSAVIKDKNIDVEKTVLLCPYAISSTSLSDKFWSKTVSKCRELGYRVFTNVGPGEKELPFTERMEESIDTVVGLVQQGVRVIGLQSGLTDIFLWAKITTPICVLNYGKTALEISFARCYGVKGNLLNKENLTYMSFADMDEDSGWKMLSEYMEEHL